MCTGSIALPQIGRDETKAVVDLALKTDAQVKVLPRASELIDRPLVQVAGDQPRGLDGAGARRSMSWRSVSISAGQRCS